MSDQKLPNLTPEEMQGILGGINTDQTLLLNAYLEEEKKWADELQELYLLKTDILEEIVAIKDEIEGIKDRVEYYSKRVKEETGILKFIKNQLGVPTEFQSELKYHTKDLEDLNLVAIDLMDKYQQIEKRYLDLSEKPPELFRYELAMLGNKLFKPY